MKLRTAKKRWNRTRRCDRQYSHRGSLRAYCYKHRAWDLWLDVPVTLQNKVRNEIYEQAMVKYSDGKYYFECHAYKGDDLHPSSRAGKDLIKRGILSVI